MIETFSKSNHSNQVKCQEIEHNFPSNNVRKDLNNQYINNVSLWGWPIAVPTLITTTKLHGSWTASLIMKKICL